MPRVPELRKKNGDWHIGAGKEKHFGQLAQSIGPAGACCATASVAAYLQTILLIKNAIP